ncbi:hypothetical protein C8R45DRAFT_926508 [Mycena sanguinolenta]|nr:hypothetical protein C8R45DRAFT_926508 [Mycena sanguinolenta]
MAPGGRYRTELSWASNTLSSSHPATQRATPSNDHIDDLSTRNSTWAHCAEVTLGLFCRYIPQFSTTRCSRWPVDDDVKPCDNETASKLSTIPTPALIEPGSELPKITVSVTRWTAIWTTTEDMSDNACGFETIFERRRFQRANTEDDQLLEDAISTFSMPVGEGGLLRPTRISSIATVMLQWAHNFHVHHPRFQHPLLQYPLICLPAQLAAALVTVVLPAVIPPAS